MEGAALLEEFKLWGHLLPAQQCKFLRPTAALINKNASPYFVLITRRSQSSPFYRPGEPRRQGSEGTCLWPRTTRSPLRSAISARELPPTALQPSPSLPCLPALPALAPTAVEGRASQKQAAAACWGAAPVPYLPDVTPSRAEGADLFWPATT